VHVGVDGVIRLREISGIEDGLTHVFSVVAADGIRKDRQKILSITGL